MGYRIAPVRIEECFPASVPVAIRDVWFVYSCDNGVPRLVASAPTARAALRIALSRAHLEPDRKRRHNPPHGSR